MKDRDALVTEPLAASPHPQAAELAQGKRERVDATSATSSQAGLRRPELIEALLTSSYTVQRPGSGELRHGTEGWRCLETSFQVAWWHWSWRCHFCVCVCVCV